MQTRKIAMLAFLSVGVITGASAADTKDIKVTASVIQNCKINSAQDIGFGQLDPSTAANVTATGGVVFVCTKDVDFNLSTDNGSHWSAEDAKRRMKGDGQNYLPYALAQSASTGKGMGFGNPITVSLSASVLGADYRNLPADGYMDNLRVSINP